MTRRFDRLASGEKLHMQSLYAMAHLDNSLAGAHSYEQAFDVARRLALPASDNEELFRRMTFNVVARNQDDHTKNIAYLMNKAGEWSLAPAFDVIYAYNPAGEWTSRHQMTINGLSDNFELADLLAVASRYSVHNASEIVGAVETAVAAWQEFANTAGVDEIAVNKIAQAHRALKP
jgi:serine/threonine-protein kinase HipA